MKRMVNRIGRVGLVVISIVGYVLRIVTLTAFFGYMITGDTNNALKMGMLYLVIVTINREGKL